MKEEKEMRRVLVVLMLAILVSQSIMVFGVSVATPTSGHDYAALAAEPERGCRYNGSDLTDHVPVFINGTSDFAAQGWPGAGSQINPYVIGRLNITYDVGLVGIRIIETQAYFVIRDCFVKQVSALTCIELYNTTHAVIEYTTVISPAGAVTCQYTNNLRISRSVATAGTDMAATIQYANDTVLQWNLFSSTHMRGLLASDCDDLRSEYNDYEALNTDWNCAYLEYCNRSSSQYDYSYRGYAGLYFGQSHNVSIVGFEGEDNGVGISVDTGPRITVSGCSIVNAADWGIELNFAPNGTISQCILTDCGTLLSDSAVYVTGSGDIQITDVQVWGTGGRGIHVGTSDRVALINNQIHETGSDGVYLLDSDAAILDQNQIHQTGENGLYLQSCENLTVTDNGIIDAEGTGAYFVECTRADVQDNVIYNVGGYGLYLATSDYINVYGNDLGYAYEACIGIGESIEPHVEQNTLEMCDEGIRISAAINATVTYNTVSRALGGIFISGTSGATVTHNTITDASTGIEALSVIGCEIEQNAIESSDEGIIVNFVQDASVNDNIIHDSGGQGIRVSSSLNLTFDGNEMTECGFVFSSAALEAEPYYNHTFTGNTVNGLPVYYMWNGSGLTLAGGSYGQVILLHCQDVTVTGGVFYRSTVAVHAFYSEEIRLTGITSDENMVGFILGGTYNSSVTDLTITDTFNGVRAYDCDYLTIQNCDISYADSRGLEIDYSAYVTIENLTIDYATYGIDAYDSDLVVLIDSEFNHISEYAVLTDGVSSAWNVTQCHFYNASYGVFIQSSEGWLIAESEFRHCQTYALYVTGGASDDGWVVRSEFYSNGNGVYVVSGDYWHIINCTMMWNANYGIWFSGVAGPEVYGNTIAINGVENGYSNVVQYWDDGISVGNSWDDYVAPPPYVISGAGATDRYPSLFLPTEPIIDSPMDVAYPEFSTGNYITWQPYDDYLRDWIVEIDESTWESGAWDFNSIVVNLDGLSYGTHTLVVTVWDIDQNSVSDEVTVVVYDGTPPVISEVPDTEAFVEGTGQSLTWDASDLHPVGYVVLLDGDQVEADEWNGGPVSASLDGLSLGLHHVTMIVHDEGGNTALDTVAILVGSDTTTPTIDSPQDITFVVQTTGNQIVWTASDDHPWSYEIAQNDTVVAAGPWNGDRILFSLDSFGLGTYDFTITVKDGARHSASDTVTVRVTPYTGYVEPPPPLDLATLLLVGGVAGVAIVIVGGALYVRKRRTTY